MKKLSTGNTSRRNHTPQVVRLNAMKNLNMLFIALIVLLSACGTGSKQGEESTTETEQKEEEKKVTAKAAMEPASGSEVSGEATFTQENGAVVFELTVQNLTPGEHAVHLHEHGDCSAEDASSAGGHWNPTMKPHGKRGNGTAFHKGDIANMSVGDDGKGTLRLSIDDWTIGGPDSTNVVGKSVIIHANPDDFTSQPAGNAGARLSCGVIKAD